MPEDPRIRALAREASARIKTLSDAHQREIETVYREFRRKAAEIQEGNADSLESSSVTSHQSTFIDRNENNYD